MTQRFLFDDQAKVAETWVEPEDQRQFDVAPGAARRNEVERLENHADGPQAVAGQAFAAQASQVVFLDLDVPGRRAVEPAQEMEQR